MYLQGTFKVIKAYTGSSKFEFWHNLKPGDTFSIEMELKDPGRGRGLYATQLVVFCNGESFRDSISGIMKYIYKMEIVQV